MRAIVQRVKCASVTVDGIIVSSIKEGLLCFIGLKEGDTADDAAKLGKDILSAKLWPSEDKKWSQNVVEMDYELLLVSQFTLHANLKSGKPDFHEAMPTEQARQDYFTFVNTLAQQYQVDKVKDGVFGSMMDVELVNDGPVTLLLDSANN